MSAIDTVSTLASLPPRIGVQPEDRLWLDAATRFEFGGPEPRAGWRHGEGPTVVLAHGWGGRAAQMVKLADRIARAGFEVVLFDARGHGESAGRRVGFNLLIEDLCALDDALRGDIHAWVCHSAAGLCLASARIQRGLHAQRRAFLATPRGPYTPIDELRRHLDPPESVLHLCRDYYARQFDMSWDELDRCSAFRHPGNAELVLVQDRDDPRVEAGDAERIARAWGRASIHRTEGLGHLKIPWSDRVAEVLVAHLCAPTSAPAIGLACGKPDDRSDPSNTGTGPRKRLSPGSGVEHPD